MTPQIYRNAVPVDLRILANPDALSEAGAALFAELAVKAIRQTQRFAVAISGGTTPSGLFDQLGSDYRESLDWTKIHIFWVDERCVPPTHAESNYRMAKVHLLDKVPLPHDNIHRMMAEKSPSLAAEDYEVELQTFFAFDPAVQAQFDLIILGIGRDGHTASLFPDTLALTETDHLVVSNYVSVLKSSRITLTYPTINAAACVLVLASGEAKAEIVSAALNHSFRETQLPIQKVLPKSGKLIWLIDAAASGRL